MKVSRGHGRRGARQRSTSSALACHGAFAQAHAHTPAPASCSPSGHKAKNLVPEAGTRATKVGLQVSNLQAALPLARVVYCSATGASEPRNMG